MFLVAERGILATTEVYYKNFFIKILLKNVLDLFLAPRNNTLEPN